MERFQKKAKNLCREFGKVTSSGGKNKQEREKAVCRRYLSASNALGEKVSLFLAEQAPFLLDDIGSLMAIMELEWFKSMLDKHIDLLERRVIKGETIPHGEKVFSIFCPLPNGLIKAK